MTLHPHDGAAVTSWNIGGWWPYYLGRVDFNAWLALPNDASRFDQILVQVHEDDNFQDDYLGWFLIDLGAEDRNQMKAYSINIQGTSGVGDHGGTLDVRVEDLHSDHEAATMLRGEGPAQCRWMDMHSDLGRDGMCVNQGSGVIDTVSWIGVLPTPANLAALGATDECTEFEQQLRSGSR